MKRTHKKRVKEQRIILPILYIHHLVMFRLIFGVRGAVVFYDVFPRYIRGIVKFLKIPYKTIESFLIVVTGIKIVKIQDGSTFTNYPYTHLKSMETTTDILLSLINKGYIKKGSFLPLIRLVGSQPTEAYCAKYLAQTYIFHIALSTTVAIESSDCRANFTIAIDPEIPAQWYPILKKELGYKGVSFFKWPSWYITIIGFFSKVIPLFEIPIASLMWILRRGICINIGKKEGFNIATEFIDPRRFNGTAYDSNYWIDETNIKKEGALFFLTNKQSKYLRKEKYKINKIKQDLKKRGYRFIFLNDLLYTTDNLREIVVYCFELLCTTLISRDIFAGRILKTAWDDYFEFRPLFTYFKFDNLIYLTLANGQTDLRFNDAIVTGLCRKNGAKSLGCQTRTIYSKKYEYCFDCFDLYFSWGEAWDNISQAKNKYITTVKIVGCIYLDSILSIAECAKKELEPSKKQLVISIFPTDLGDRHHYTENYTLSFLRKCIRFAEKYPEVIFILKGKDPEFSKKLLKNKDFFKQYSRVKENFHIIGNRYRNEYVDVLSKSSIVLSIGYTTPGIEGLLLGKRSIYYSELKAGGQAVDRLPEFVADSSESFNLIFETALKDYKNYNFKHRSIIATLDPYRDGMALKRISNLLD